MTSLTAGARAGPVGAPQPPTADEVAVLARDLRDDVHECVRDRGVEVGLVGDGLAVPDGAAADVEECTDALLREPRSASFAEITAPTAAQYRDGPLLRHPEPSTGDGLDAGIVGTLESDADCLYVRGELDIRYPVIWPAGTRWIEASRSVRLPSGEFIAIGQHVVGSGGYFGGDTLAQHIDPHLAQLAVECTENHRDEVAVVNNNDRAITASE